MTIRLNGVTVATTMRTPGHDYELAVGWCFTDGLLGAAAVSGVRYCADGSASASGFNVVSVEAPGAPPPTPRLGTISSSCGLCGVEAIEAVAARIEPVDGTAPLPSPQVITGLAEAVRASQPLFAATGAVHAAATFDRQGAIGLVREDVGRHNAVDKIVGRLLLDGALPRRTGTEMGLFVSGRASFELVVKAWAAGCRWMVAVSAPTALAADTARRAGLGLVGFSRADGFNVYAP